MLDAALGTSHWTRCQFIINKMPRTTHPPTESSMLLLVGNDVSETLAVSVFKVKVFKL
jgi:hypothetical protein